VARTEARMTVGMYRTDTDLINLSVAAKAVYGMLVTEPELEHTGVMPITLRRWARSFPDIGQTGVETALRELHQARFIVLDEEHEQVLIRALIRRDKVYKQPNVLKSAADRLSRVFSPTIRAALHAELVRVRELDDVPENAMPVLDRMIEALAEAGVSAAQNPSPYPFTEFGNDPGNPLGDKDHSPVPFPLSPDPSPSSAQTPPAGCAPKPAPKQRRTVAGEPVGFAEWYAAYPRKEGRKDAARAYAKAAKALPADELLEKTREFQEFTKHREKRFIPLPATWLNGERWNDDMSTPARAASGGAHGAAYADPTDLSVYDEDL